MLFNREIETMSHESLRELQNKRLRNTVQYVYEQVPYYREVFDRLSIKPSDIQTVEDLPKIPFTKKQTLRDYYPFGLLAVPRENLIRIHASSGTTGKATVVCYTRNDIEIFSEVMARSFVAAGARPSPLSPRSPASARSTLRSRATSLVARARRNSEYLK